MRPPAGQFVCDLGTRGRYHGDMTDSFDVVIAGGGLVGMCAAAALEGSGLRVLQIEAQAPPQLVAAWDERHFALGRASVERLRGIGVWSDAIASAPIREVHVSRAGAFGRVLMRAADQGLTAFGCTVPARLLVAALEQSVQRDGLLRWRPARLLGWQGAAEGLALRVAVDGTERDVQTRLLVAADGSDSAIRASAAIPTQAYGYGQTALVCAAEVQHEHGGRAFERLTDDGPIAVLPLEGRRCGIVCTLDDGAAGAALACSDADYIELLQARFGHRLGRILRVGRRQPWPLRLLTAERLHDDRVVLIGNAAQTIHPIGAQGFNLGLRDAVALAEVLRDHADDVGAPDVLRRYAASRTADREQTIMMSHQLLRLSSAPGLPLTILRGLAMAMIDRVVPLRSALARSSMGYRSRSA